MSRHTSKGSQLIPKPLFINEADKGWLKTIYQHPGIDKLVITALYLASSRNDLLNQILIYNSAPRDQLDYSLKNKKV